VKEIPPARWPVVLVAALTTYSVSKVLLTGVRRFLRWQRERTVENAARRLALGLPAFKLARGRDLVDLLMVDPAVLEAVEEHEEPRAAMRRAERYALEIVPSFSPYLYFRVGLPLAGLVSRALYRLGSEGGQAVGGDATVVFVMNHRSNLDYVILAHLTRNRAALSFAAGEWARVWPVGWLVRAMGSFFVRRGSGDSLHRRVLERFVQMAVEGGLTQVIFPEGGLNRDGRPREPKVGLLDYMLRRFDPSSGRDLLFVPVAVNYDRVLEDRALLAALEPGASGPNDRLIPSQAASFVSRNLRFALGGGRDRRPYAVVNFGAPVSARRYTSSRSLDFRALDDETRAGQVELLAQELMRTVRELVPVLPVPAIAHVLVGYSGEALTGSEIKARARALTSSLQARGARVHLPGGERDIEAGLDLLAARRLVVKEDDLYRISPREIKLLRYYAASISHLIEAGRDTGAFSREGSVESD
jgi:glycerol-3-phosphate O-acyltransferase